VNDTTTESRRIREDEMNRYPTLQKTESTRSGLFQKRRCSIEHVVNTGIVLRRSRHSCLVEHPRAVNGYVSILPRVFCDANPLLTWSWLHCSWLSLLVATFQYYYRTYRKKHPTSSFWDKKNHHWSDEDKNDFFDALAAYGRDWEKIANKVGRTPKAVELFYYKTYRKDNLEDTAASRSGGGGIESSATEETAENQSESPKTKRSKRRCRRCGHAFSLDKWKVFHVGIGKRWRPGDVCTVPKEMIAEGFPVAVGVRMHDLKRQKKTVTFLLNPS